MTTTTKKSKTGFHIGVTCPGCASKLELQENFFVISCEYCGSVLRIMMPDIPAAYLIKGEIPKNEIRFHIDRYLKKNGLPLTGSYMEIKPLYFPYWKVDAVILKVRNKKFERFAGTTDDQGRDLSYEQEVSDIRLAPYTSTISANSDFPYIPHSIGMRTEYIRLDTFATQNIDDEFACIPAQKSWEQTLEDLEKTINAIDKVHTADFGKNLTELFHPRGSMVYYPYYFVESEYKGVNRQFMLDGKFGTVLRYDEEPFFNADSVPDTDSSMTFGELIVDFHRCLNCGIDLPETKSVVYTCKNCQDLILLEKLPFNIDSLAMVDGSSGLNDRMFPFWSLKMSEADQAHLGQFFGGIYQSDRMVIPAFRMANFEAMYRLTKRFSSAIRTIDLIPIEGRQDDRFAPVDLPLSEALILADAIIYRELVGKEFYDKAKRNEFSPVEVSLFYAPFKPQSYFYVDSIQGAITFEKNLIS